MMRRRRFLSIAAAMAATPTLGATTHRWSGQALGADVEIALLASPDQASAAIKEARAIIQKMEALFSLYRPSSDLVRLNTMGEVRHPSVEFLALFEIAD
ncbi:MAG: FAD:protein FMN transferase, partial [Pseudomonadota bacterium]